jgi:acyl-CoA reductase-like NAD-dependent aldehyde dehydrogenase
LIYLTLFDDRPVGSRFCYLGPPTFIGRRAFPRCADLDQATDALIGAGYGAAGGRCMAISVAVAVGDVGDPLIEKLAPRVQALKVGPGLDPQSEMGPLETRQHRDKVMGYVDQGVKEGARLVVDGRGLKLQGYENGNFMGGCLFDNVTRVVISRGTPAAIALNKRVAETMAS